MITSNVIEIIGAEPGPTLALFAGIHGDETAGVFAFEELIPALTIPRGKILFAYGNPAAIKANTRMITKNLNRCFYKGNDGTDPEDIRARELMAVLDQADALLDLHMFYDDDGLPFVICEDNAVELASKFDVDVISTNWTATEPGGTDGYMYENGKIGICIECGPISKAREYKDYAIKTIMQFLTYFGMADAEYSNTPKRLVRAEHAIFKSSEDFVLESGLHNFDRLTDGQLLAIENDVRFTGKTNECIIFPHYKARVGEEAYIIGAEID